MPLCIAQAKHYLYHTHTYAPQILKWPIRCTFTQYHERHNTIALSPQNNIFTIQIHCKYSFTLKQIQTADNATMMNFSFWLQCKQWHNKLWYGKGAKDTGTYIWSFSLMGLTLNYLLSEWQFVFRFKCCLKMRKVQLKFDSWNSMQIRWLEFVWNLCGNVIEWSLQTFHIWPLVGFWNIECCHSMVLHRNHSRCLCF